MTPVELLEKQRAALMSGGFEVLDLVQNYVSGLNLTRSAKLSTYNIIRSFFKHNRCPLPDDGSFIVRSSKPAPIARLTLENVQALVLNCNLRDRSLVLVKWQSMVDAERLAYVNKFCVEQIVKQIREGVHPIRLDIPGRHGNPRGFYTFFGKDARDALVAYFEKERGWPRSGEGIWVGKGRALSTRGIKAVWLRLTKRAGLIPRKGGVRGTQYGYGSHEMRDLAKSLLHTHAKKDGFDMDACDFWLGHTIDKLGYDKFYQDREYVQKQYLIAEKYLNIISRPEVSEEQRHQEQETVLKMRRELDEVKELVNQLLGAKTGSDSIR